MFEKNYFQTMSNEERQKMVRVFSKPELAIEILSVFGLILTFIYVAIHYGQLPDTIPTHFGFSGEPDGWGGKGILWLFPCIGLFLYAMMTVLIFFPQAYNTPTRVTAENAFRLYRFMRVTMAGMKLVFIWLFGYIIYATIQTAYGNTPGVGGAFLWIF